MVNFMCQPGPDFGQICDPMGYTVHGILQAGILKWVTFSFSRGSSQPKDWTQISHIAGGFFTNWATPSNSKHTGVGSLFFLQGIFPTKESNRGLPHCSQILYQLSYNRHSFLAEHQSRFCCEAILGVKVKVVLTLYDPMIYKVHGILRPEYWRG